MPSQKLPTIRVPDEWMTAIDKRRGNQSISDYIRGLILDDLPKRVAKSLPEAGKPGRRWPKSSDST